MTSGPGITGKTDSPDDAIEEISGLLEMDELKASEAGVEDSAPAHAVSEAVGDALDVAMETPSPAKLDAYLPPPPVSEEPSEPESAEGEAGLGSNMAYEDLLEKLVLPAQPAAVEEEPAAHQVTPRPSSVLASSPPESLFPSNATPGPVASDERTVVTVNPLLAEEQEAAARGAESYILPAAPPPQPLLPNTPVAVVQPRPVTPPKFAVLPGKIVQATYPVFGGIVLGGIILGVLVGRASAPTKVIEKVSVVQAQPVAAATAVPVQAAQTASPTPEVVPLPTPSEAPKPAAEPAAEPTAKRAQPAAAAAAAAEEPAAEEAKPEPKPKTHHASKASRPAKAATRPAAAAKPNAVAKPAAAAKPAGGKKPGQGWVDPFAN